MAAKMTKLATRRLTISIASRRTKNRTRKSLSSNTWSGSSLGPAQLVRPRREHVGKRGICPGEIGARYQRHPGLEDRDPGLVGRDGFFDVGHLLGARVGVGGAARVVKHLEDLGVVGSVRVAARDTPTVEVLRPLGDE